MSLVFEGRLHTFHPNTYLSRKDITAEESAALDSYAEYLIEQGADVTRETFLDMDAIFSTYTNR